MATTSNAASVWLPATASIVPYLSLRGALAHAGELANKELPEEVKNLKERYGFKTLKKLLEGSEIFDVFDERLSDGRFRTLYKNRGIH